MSIYLTIHFSIYLSINLSVYHQPINLSIHCSFYFSIIYSLYIFTVSFNVFYVHLISFKNLRILPPFPHFFSSLLLLPFLHLSLGFFSHKHGVATRDAWVHLAHFSQNKGVVFRPKQTITFKQ